MAPSQRVRGRTSGPHTHTRAQKEHRNDLQEDRMVYYIGEIIALVRAYPGRRRKGSGGWSGGGGADKV